MVRGEDHSIDEVTLQAFTRSLGKYLAKMRRATDGNFEIRQVWKMSCELSRLPVVTT